MVPAKRAHGHLRYMLFLYGLLGKPTMNAQAPPGQAALAGCGALPARVTGGADPSVPSCCACSSGNGAGGLTSAPDQLCPQAHGPPGTGQAAASASAAPGARPAASGPTPEGPPGSCSSSSTAGSGASNEVRGRGPVQEAQPEPSTSASASDGPPAIPPGFKTPPGGIVFQVCRGADAPIKGG